MRLRRLQLIAMTDQGRYGCDLTFQDGLVVLRAENTSGKSTCVQAIVYVLGMEPMLTTRHEVPLPHAMTSYLETGDGRATVLESWVSLEVEGASGDIKTLQRWALPPEGIGTNLVRVWDGPALSDPNGGWPTTDRFARLRHSAEGPRGLYPVIEELLGWKAPQLHRPDGSDVLLYLEMIFPLFIVEQKRGWSAIQAQMPPYTNVPEPRKRAIEHVLGLSVYERARARAAVEARLSAARIAWEAAIDIFERELESSDVVLRDVPRPSPTWPPAVVPGLSIAGAGGTRALSAELTTITERLSVIESSEVPRAEEAASEAATRLRAAEHELNSVLDLARSLQTQVRENDRQHDALDHRLRGLEEDRRLSEDTRTINKLGGDSGTAVLDGHCPTCHQDVPDDLMLVDSPTHALSLEDSINLIREQETVFEALRENVAVALDDGRAQLRGVTARADELRSEIRALRESLLGPAGQPSLAVLEERVRLHARLDRLTRFQESLSGLTTELEALAQRIAAATSTLKATPKDGLDQQDHARLASLRSVVVEQLAAYKFSSIAPQEVGLSETRYLPAQEGYDLGFDVSASDWIRLIWAYLLGLLEVSRGGGHHAGLVIFDEPRQQDADPVSFEALLRRATETKQAGQQVLFATSEPLSSLESMLDGSSADVHHFAGLILGPLD